MDVLNYTIREPRKRKFFFLSCFLFLIILCASVLVDLADFPTDPIVCSAEDVEEQQTDYNGNSFHFHFEKKIYPLIWEKYNWAMNQMDARRRK